MHISGIKYRPTSIKWDEIQAVISRGDRRLSDLLIKVYEYKPGFIHSKTFVSDDKIGVVGSANMDYRSMNLNYECISLIYDTGTEKDIKNDFINMIENSCIEVKLKDWIKRPFYKKIVESLLTTFSTMF